MKRIFIFILSGLLILASVMLAFSFVELNDIFEEGKDIVSGENTPEDNPEDTPEDNPGENVPEDPPEEVPDTPPAELPEEDPFVAKDTSDAALYNVFASSTVGSKDGAVVDDLGLIGPSLNGFLPDGLTVYENGVMVFNDTTPGYFYEVGDVGGAESGFAHSFYYRVFKNGAWESNLQAVDETNFVIYLLFSYDVDTYEPPEQYKGSFDPLDGLCGCEVYIGLAEGFTPDFEGFRLYALME